MFDLKKQLLRRRISQSIKGEEEEYFIWLQEDVEYLIWLSGLCGRISHLVEHNMQTNQQMKH